MQVVVKTPRIRMEGEISGTLVQYLRDQYGEIEIIEDPEEELVEVRNSDWYRSFRGAISPGENLRVYRELHGLTQDQLAAKIGTLTKQNISNMENGRRSISKSLAKQLAALFEVSVEKFI